MIEAQATVPLGSVTTWSSGGTPNRANSSYWRGSIPWISAATLKRSRIEDSDQHLTEEGLRSGSRLAPRGATLVLVRGMALHRETRIGLATRPVSFNQDVKALVPNPGLLPEFLLYALQARSGDILELVSSAGSGTGVLNTQLLKRLPVWVPDEETQRGVVAAVDAADRQVQTLERVISKKQAIEQGLLQHLLTGRSRLPGFDDVWADVRLGDHVTYLRTVALSRAQLDSSSPLRYLHYGDIHTRPNVTMDAAREKMPRAASLLAGRAERLRIGDLVFADASEDPDGVGKSVEIVGVPVEGVVPGLHTIAARFDKGVLADGFKAYLQCIPSFRDQLLRLAAGTKVLATTRSYISSVCLPLPGVAEQRAIAEVLQEADRELGVLASRLAKARAIKTGMMQELLTGRTRLPLETGS
jgi:type I restriction enzyme S subunit